MNWPFRSLRTIPPASPSAVPPGCDPIEPLLPLYADGMAAPDEMRLVEAHLPGCAGCRESLFWMQATHRALAARPVAVPPADLHSRIAKAIAASSAAPSLRPARSFTLRPAYAAAASLTTIGAVGLALSYPLWHSPVPPAGMGKPASPQALASLPPAKAHAAASMLPRRSVRPLVASSAAAFLKPAVRPAPVLRRKAAPVIAAAPQDQIADNAPAQTFVPLHAQTKPAVHFLAAPHDKPLVASRITAAEKRHPEAPKLLAPKLPAVPLLARRDKEPLPVPVHIDPPTVIVQPPAVRTASSTTDSGGLLAVVNAKARALQTVAYGKNSLMERQISRGGISAIHALDNEHTGYQPAVYSP